MDAAVPIRRLFALGAVLAGWLIARGLASETGVLMVVIDLIGPNLSPAFPTRQR